MINVGATGHPTSTPVDPLVRPALVAASPPGATTTAHVTLQELFDAHFDFVWRSVRRFGVPDASVDDAVQEVFLVAMRRLAVIEPGRERSFLFGTAMRVASGLRRSVNRRRDQVADDADALDAISGAPGADALLDQKRARALLDRCVEALPLDLRAVFILFELEDMTAAAIADLLAIPPGTVASRLRRARALFEQAVARASIPTEVRRG